jgi:hypothetical protein
LDGLRVNQDLVVERIVYNAQGEADYTGGVNHLILPKIRVALLLAAAIAFSPWNPAAAQLPLPRVKVFDPDPNHIWNRTYACLFVRQTPNGTEYGADALDPLLWSETQHLLKGDSHRRALACLDVFLRSHTERAVQNPLKRAIFQRDLWALFDWAAAGQSLPQQRRELEVRLADAIRRLAITSEQVRALPDTYAAALATRQFELAYEPLNSRQPFLPPELFRSDGPWVCLSAYSDEPTAIVHFSGRSRFLVFMRLPGGRDATLAYIHKLRSSSEAPLLNNGSPSTRLNLALPQFPVGTAVALVRQMIVIDNHGKLAPTALTESVQLRVYHAITPGTQFMNYINGPSSHDQDFFEFRMSRPELFARHSGGLVAVHPGETEFVTFRTQGTDAFESTTPLDQQGVILEGCRSCHSDSGIHSVQSRLQWMKLSQSLNTEIDGGKHGDPITWETDVTITRKQQQPDFNLLLDLWKSVPR